MNFKEYFEEKNIEDVFIENLLTEYGFLDTITAPARFVGAGATNLGYQAGRGLLNVGKGSGRLAKGFGKAGLGVLQTLTGDPVRGVKTAAGGVGDAVAGAVDIGKGAAQIGLSPASSVARGVQAAAEPAEVQPFDAKTSKFQKFFGLNSWRTSKEKAEERNNEFKKLMLTHAMLMDLYKKSKTKEEKKILKEKMKNVRSQMKEINPDKYKDLERRAESLRVAHFAAKSAENFATA